MVAGKRRSKFRCGAFTLPEVTIASSVALVIAGSFVMILVQAAVEQQRGLANTTVEQKAYILQSSIAACLRTTSATAGISPIFGTGPYDTNSNYVGYQSIYAFQANTNGGYTRQRISFNSATGKVAYTADDAGHPQNQVVWMTSGATAVLRDLRFNTSLNPDGSLNASLVQVRFQMDDNGWSPRNPTGIYRSFCVHMRSD